MRWVGSDFGFVPIPAFSLDFLQIVGWRLAMEGDHRRASGYGPSNSKDGD